MKENTSEVSRLNILQGACERLEKFRSELIRMQERQQRYDRLLDQMALRIRVLESMLGEPDRPISDKSDYQMVPANKIMEEISAVHDSLDTLFTEYDKVSEHSRLVARTIGEDKVFEQIEKERLERERDDDDDDDDVDDEDDATVERLG